MTTGLGIWARCSSGRSIPSTTPAREMARSRTPSQRRWRRSSAYRNAEWSWTKARYGEDDQANHVVGFIERYQVRFEGREHPWNRYRRDGCSRRCAEVGREFNLEFEYRSPPARSAHRQRPGRHPGRGFDIDRQRNAPQGFGTGSATRAGKWNFCPNWSDVMTLNFIKSRQT